MDRPKSKSLPTWAALHRDFWEVKKKIGLDHDTYTSFTEVARVGERLAERSDVDLLKRR